MTLEHDAADAPHEEGERVSERMRILLAEAAEGVGRAVDACLHAQKEGAARRLFGISAALRQSTPALEESENETLARYADRAAAQLEEASASLRERDWRDLMQEAERFARREPALYIAGALAAGFIGGWFLVASSDRPSSSIAPEPASADGEAAPVMRKLS